MSMRVSVSAALRASLRASRLGAGGAAAGAAAAAAAASSSAAVVRRLSSEAVSSAPSALPPITSTEPVEHPLTSHAWTAAKLEEIGAREVERSTSLTSCTEDESRVLVDAFRLHNSSMPLRDLVVRGRVLKVNPSHVLVDTGVRLARVPSVDLTRDSVVGWWGEGEPLPAPTEAERARGGKRLPPVRVGDVIAVSLQGTDTPEGLFGARGAGGAGGGALKRRAAGVWEEVQRAHREGTVVHGRVLNRLAGGYSVGVGGLVCYLPANLCSRATARAVGVLRPFRVESVNKAAFNVVLADVSLADELEQSLPQGEGREPAAHGAAAEGQASSTVAANADPADEARRAMEHLKGVLPKSS